MTIEDRDLEAAARRLGARAATRLDPERTGAAVVARLRASRGGPWWATAGLLRAAAAVALLLGVGVYGTDLLRRGGSPPVAPPVQLQTLSVAELEEVLDSLVVETPATSHLSAGLGDLDESQLRELLRSLEG